MLGERFWSKVDKSGECWLWTASKDRNGYGHFAVNNTPLLAHRLAYQELIGPIPTEQELDHLCRNPSCVNSEHLRAISHRENILCGNTQPALNARKTRCIHGHAFDQKNTYRRRGGKRMCRECGRQRKREYRRRLLWRS